MEVEDDDIFFANLSKQIALLITEGDEITDESATRYPSVSLQSFSNSMTMPSPLAYEVMACTRDSKGPGVFIPRLPVPRRKNKPGRHTSFNSNKTSKQPDKARRGSRTTTDLGFSCNRFYSSKIVKETESILKEKP